MRTRPLLLLLTASLCSSDTGGTSDGNVKQSVTSWATNRSAEYSFLDEVAILKAAADKGDGRALGIISVLWQRGGNGNTDSSVALETAKASTAQRDPFGYYALALIYRDGVGAKKSQKKAADLGRQAFAELHRYAESGDPWGQVFIGELLDSGLGVERDHARALAWHRKSANQGNVVAQRNLANVPESIVETAQPPTGLSVLILGDSMSLSGFGKRLDQRFRRDRRVQSTFTYMACGTNPLSWLKKGPFLNVKTFCGFWSIESVAGEKEPKEFRDTYGTKWAHFPKAYAVPKLEDLLTTLRPDVLVMQSGTNLLSLFRDGKTLLPERQGPTLRKHIAPFMSKALDAPRPLRRIYWVASPTSARVSESIQQFILDQIRAEAGSAADVIDSRKLLSYPYRDMEVDNEHFVGVEMDEWADKVFAIVERDMVALSLSPHAPDRAPTPLSLDEMAKSEESAGNLIELTGKLVLKSQPLRVAELLPYQESLVTYVYDVVEVLKGSYTERQVLVVHPAHIRLKAQPLEQYQIGNIYKLRLRQLEGTPWQTVKGKDESEILSLEPYIQVEDEVRFPGLVPPAVSKKP